MKVIDVFALFKETIARWSKNGLAAQGAALAFYAVFSLTPILIISVAVVGLFFGSNPSQQVMQQLEIFLGREGVEFVRLIGENTTKTPSGVIATFWSAIALIAGASGVFVQLQYTLNVIWNVRADPSEGWLQLFRSRIISFALVVAIGGLILLSLILSATLAGVQDHIAELLPETLRIAHLMEIFLSFCVTSILFAVLFKALPDAKISWQDTWIGALFTAALFTLGKLLIAFYLGRSSVASAYGAAGSLAALLLWIYYSAQIFLFGAQTTVVYTEMKRRVKPEDFSMRSTQPASKSASKPAI